MFQGVGSPTYDYYTFDNNGNTIGGKTGNTSNVTDRTILEEAPSGTFEIINSTIDGAFNVTIYSELAPTARVQR